MLRNLALVIIFAALFCLTVSGCVRPKTPESAQQSTVISEGSTPPNPDYFVNEKGEVIYNGSPTGDEGKHNPDYPPLFPGANRIYPAKDDPSLRESYLTRASMEAILDFYSNFLDVRKSDPTQGSQLAEKVGLVQSIEFRDRDGRRQAALFINKDEGPRSGLKVMVKEFPEQHAVQIVLTTLDATPPGINPIGTYVSPEEVEQWAKDQAAKQEEERRRREAIEKQAQNQGSTSQ